MAEEKTLGRKEYSIRCMEIGDVDCPWTARGYDEQEVMHQVEQHGREQHGWSSLTQGIKDKVRRIMNKAA